MTRKKPVCPKCNKRAIEVRNYKDGSKLYVHEEKRVLGWREIAGCNVREDVAP